MTFSAHESRLTKAAALLRALKNWRTDRHQPERTTSYTFSSVPASKAMAAVCSLERQLQSERELREELQGGKESQASQAAEAMLQVKELKAEVEDVYARVSIWIYQCLRHPVLSAVNIACD